MSTFFSRSHIDQLQQYLVAMVAGRLEEPFSVTSCGNKTQGGGEIEPPIKTNEFKETDLDYNNDEEDKTEPESRNFVNTSDGLRSDHGNTGSRRADVENTDIVHKKPYLRHINGTCQVRSSSIFPEDGTLFLTVVHNPNVLPTTTGTIYGIK